MRWLGKATKPGFHHDPGFPEMTGVSYRDVLDRFEALTRPAWYLEIGARNGSSLRNRKCSFVAVDPVFALREGCAAGDGQMHFMQMTSDDFFASDFLARNGLKMDFAFIDGLHLFEFALRDFINCEKSMTAGGHVFLHDVAPFNDEMTTRDPGYLALNRPWTGDVWKVIAVLREYRPELRVEIVSAAMTGLGCVTGLSPDSTVLSDNYDAIVARYAPMTLADYGVAALFSPDGMVTPQAFLSRYGG